MGNSVNKNVPRVRMNENNDINPSPKQETICAARQRQIEEGEVLVLNEEHHCQRQGRREKIDLAKPQQADCLLFGARVNKHVF